MTISTFKFYKAIDQYLIREHISASAQQQQLRMSALLSDTTVSPVLSLGRESLQSYNFTWAVNIWEKSVFTDTVILGVYQLTAIWVL